MTGGSLEPKLGLMDLRGGFEGGEVIEARGRELESGVEEEESGGGGREGRHGGEEGREKLWRWRKRS